MILSAIKKFLVVLLSMVTLFQSTGLIDELLDLKFKKSFVIQMDLEGDTDKEDEKLEIDKIIRNHEEGHLFLDHNSQDLIGHNISLRLFVFEIPIPPPEFS